MESWDRPPPPGQSRYQPSAGKGIRTCHSQARVTDPRGGGRNRAGEHVEAAPDHWKKPFAGTCQFKGPRTTTKERLTTNVLKEPDLVADCGRRHAKFVRRLTEAHVPCGSLEGAKGSQRRKLSHCESVGEFNSSGD